MAPAHSQLGRQCFVQLRHPQLFKQALLHCWHPLLAHSYPLTRQAPARPPESITTTGLILQLDSEGVHQLPQQQGLDSSVLLQCPEAPLLQQPHPAPWT